MRSYSRHKLIEDELNRLPTGRSSWIEKMVYRINKRVKVDYTISVPATVFLRILAFCDDVSELSELIFTPADLLDLLYDDFLMFTRRTDDVEVIHTQLMMKWNGTVKRFPTKVKSTNEKEGKSRFSSYIMVEEQEEKRENGKTINLQVSFVRKKALRGEIVFSDMSEQFPDHPFTLEKLLEILLCDFIEEYKKGNHKEVLTRIVKNLNK
ncbi:MAG: hypothetical protein Q8934_23585 [Bacillota bacterium]|nr:hypothetical protein [Bacillota bacterium]